MNGSIRGTSSIDLLALIGRDTPLRRTCSVAGGEYAGPCPLCRRGTDRFKVWPQAGRWACLGPKAGRSGCDREGDAIQYLRERDRLSFQEACARLGLEGRSAPAAISRPAVNSRPALQGRGPRVDCSPAAVAPRPGADASPAPPNAAWQRRASAWVAACVAALWGPEGERARAYLHGRGLEDAVLKAFAVGYHAQEGFEAYGDWGLAQPAGRSRRIWLPRGITLPWMADGALWRVNVRRPLSPAQIARGEAKYIGPAGWVNTLYNAASVRPDRPVVLVEGEFDALTIVQACGDEVAVVATGSTSGGRSAACVARLALAPSVLVAFDDDPPGRAGAVGAGDQAAAWWLNVLPRAVRWRPWLHDVNSMPAVEDVRAWVRGGGERVSG